MDEIVSPEVPDGPLIDDVTLVPSPPADTDNIIILPRTSRRPINGRGRGRRLPPGVVYADSGDGRPPPPPGWASRNRRNHYLDPVSDSSSNSGSGTGFGRSRSGSGSGSEVGPAGMLTDVKFLYKDDIKRHSWWTDSVPKSNNSNTSKYAIVARNVFNDADEPGDSRTKLHSIVVQSPLLRQVLKDLLDGYPGIGLKGEKLTFVVPFQPIVHRWTAIERAVEFETNEETKTHLNLFVVIIKPAIKESLEAIENFAESREIAFSQLWTICQPKEIIWSMVDMVDRAFLLKKAEYVNVQGRTMLLMNCSYIDWDGIKFGKATTSLLIPAYQGTEKITGLMAFPIRYHAEENIQERLKERGEKLEKYRGYHYMAYNGVAISTLSTPPQPKHVEGRIVIDSKTYLDVNAGEEVNITALDQEGDDDAASSVDSFERFDDNPERPRLYHGSRRRRYRSRDSSLDGFNETGLPRIEDIRLSMDQLLICTNKVRGFSLKLKEWLNFDISKVVPIKWNNDAFDNLVLPGGYKKLILAFANSQRQSKQTFDDVIAGKGKGIVMLLNGPPGVGKTLTAESVAETMKVPLYSISAGDLGIEPREVERKLLSIFQLAKAWNAVILLDEADVFLEKRRLEDLLRNELVSIFLQNLEYFQSTLFLTTNRVETFDPAFESRIHISITYPPLSNDSRKTVWSNFLNRLRQSQLSAATLATTLTSDVGPVPAVSEGTENQDRVPGAHEVSEEDLIDLSKEELNGRQIKNIIKAAELLALEDKESLKVTHLKTVLGIMRGTLSD